MGTVKRRHTTKNWVVVLWDNGKQDEYRSGAEDAMDISVLDNGPTGKRVSGGGGGGGLVRVHMCR